MVRWYTVSGVVLVILVFVLVAIVVVVSAI